MYIWIHTYLKKHKDILCRTLKEKKSTPSKLQECKKSQSFQSMSSPKPGQLHGVAISISF